jgi:hypothetical protein
MNMKVTVTKEEFLQFKTVRMCHIPEITNNYTAFDL